MNHQPSTQPLRQVEPGAIAQSVVATALGWIPAARVGAPGSPGHRPVVIGYGPTGRTVIRLLKENGIEPTIIELNIDSLRTLRQEGVNAVYGDATRPVVAPEGPGPTR